VVLLLMIVVAVLAPWLGTVDPQAVAPVKRLKQPSGDFWFGSDMMGRDVYSRVLYGARVSLAIGISVALFSTLVGLAIGLVTGFLRSVDAVVMRVMDGLMSIPPVLLAIALMALTRASMQKRDPRHHARGNAAGRAAGARPCAHLARRAVRCRCGRRREQSPADAVAAHPPEHRGAADRAGDLRLRLRDDHRGHLSFIGAGTPPNIPSWGNIMAEARSSSRSRAT
jgi:peptide/nickel transport system permease protein